MQLKLFTSNLFSYPTGVLSFSYTVFMAFENQADWFVENSNYNLNICQYVLVSVSVIIFLVLGTMTQLYCIHISAHFWNVSWKILKKIAFPRSHIDFWENFPVPFLQSSAQEGIGPFTSAHVILHRLQLLPMLVQLHFQICRQEGDSFQSQFTCRAGIELTSSF